MRVLNADNDVAPKCICKGHQVQEQVVNLVVMPLMCWMKNDLLKVYERIFRRVGLNQFPNIIPGDLRNEFAV